MCIVSLFCVKNTKNQKQMFIFYVSLTLYKLFEDCQAGNNGVFSGSCYFCNVSVCHTRVSGESKGCVCPHQIVCLLPEVVHCLQNLPHYSSFGVLSGSRPKSQWDPWLLAWPMALVGPWLSVWPVAFGGTTQGYWRGPWHWWDLWLTEWPVAIGGTPCG